MRTNQLSGILLIGVVALLALTACGDEEATTTTTQQQKEKTKDEQLTDTPKEQDITYTYNAVDRRDPFMTYFDALVNPVDETNLTELQKIDLDKLKLTAVVVGTATPMAMVEDPAGHGHTVKIGTLIGKRLGQVKHIRRGEIVVQEDIRDFTGKRVPQLKEMKLETDEKKQ